MPLNISPSAAVTAPSANLPPAATEATPPAVAVIDTRATKLFVGRIGPTAAPVAADSAPAPHLPPEATAEAHPTAAWPATFARCCGDPKSGCGWPGPNVISPTMLKANAVA